MSRVVLLCFFALTFRPEALSVQRVEGEDSPPVPSKPWSFWRRPHKSKNALLVILGLLREFDGFWPKVLKNFIEPNEKDGYEFTIVLHTSLTVNCSPKDVKSGRLEWCSMMIEHFGATPEERRKSLQQMFAPREVRIVDTPDTCWTNPREPNRSTTEYLDGWWRSADCSGTVHFSSRGAQALDAFSGARGFTRVAIVRTDNCFELSGHPGQDLPVMLDEACRDHPGVNIVGNYNENPTYYVRDYDHAWMLCDGSRADAFRDAVAAFGLPCQASCYDGEAPSCPRGFCRPGAKMDCLENLCESASILERAGVPFGTVDSYMVANYQITRRASGAIALGVEPGDLDSRGNVLF